MSEFNPQDQPELKAEGLGAREGKDMPQIG